MNPASVIFLNLAKGIGPFIAMIAMNALKTVVNIAYASFFKTIEEAIIYAEKEIKGSLDKKQAVIDKVMEFVKKHKKLNAIQEFTVKLFIGRIVDNLIELANDPEGYGKNWVEVLKEYERILNEKIDYIDPLKN